MIFSYFEPEILSYFSFIRFLSCLIYSQKCVEQLTLGLKASAWGAEGQRFESGRGQARTDVAGWPAWSCYFHSSFRITSVV